MKQLALAPCVGIALVLHAGAIAVAWFGLASAGAAARETAPQVCQSVALAATPQQQWPQSSQAAQSTLMPQPDVPAVSPVARPQGDTELQQAPESPPPLPDPQPELRHTDLPFARLPAPAEQPWTSAPAQPKQQPAAPADSGTTRVDQPAAVWVAPRILKWQAPEKVRAGFHGRVVAVLTIDHRGKVVAVELAQGTGNQGWDALLRKSFEDASCAAATCDNRPTQGVLRQPVDFP